MEAFMYKFHPLWVHVKNIIQTNNIGKRIVEFEPADQYGIMFDIFANAVINNLPFPVPINDTVNNQKVVDAVFKSEKSNSRETIV